MFAFALLVAAAVLLDMVLGAVVTNLLSLGVASAPGLSILTLAVHRHVSEGAGTLVLILAAWITFGGNSARVKRISWLALACVVAEALLGRVAVPLTPQQIVAGTPDLVGFLHAFIAQLLFGFVVALVVSTWPGWEKAPVPIADKGWPSLRSLSHSTAGALVLQVALGASFVHNLLGVLWHILGAFLVVIFGLAMLVIITQVPENRSLRAPVIWLACLLGVQITLGMVLISISAPAKHPMVSAITVALHVLAGSSALGVGVMSAMLVRRSVHVMTTEPAC
jgi:heme A synthase